MVVFSRFLNFFFFKTEKKKNEMNMDKLFSPGFDHRFSTEPLSDLLASLPVEAATPPITLDLDCTEHETGEIAQLLLPLVARFKNLRVLTSLGPEPVKRELEESGAWRTENVVLTGADGRFLRVVGAAAVASARAVRAFFGFDRLEAGLMEELSQRTRRAVWQRWALEGEAVQIDLSGSQRGGAFAAM